MLRHLLWFCFALLLVITFHSCKDQKDSIGDLTRDSFREFINPCFVVDANQIHKELRKCCMEKVDLTLQDAVLNEIYHRKDTFIWINHLLSGDQADTLLTYLEKSSSHGLNLERFSTSKIKTLLKEIRTMKFGNKENLNKLLARLEYNLSLSYLDYACGMAFGFVNPGHVLNNLEEEEPDVDANGKEIVLPLGQKAKMKRLYNISLQRCDRAFIDSALNAVDKHLPDFLQGLQPKRGFYIRLQKEYQKYDTINADAQKDIPEIGELLLKTGDRNPVIPLIAKRLKLLGIISEDSWLDTTHETVVPELLDAVNIFRERNQMPKDTLIGSYTIRMLNKSLSYYKDRLQINMERLRWHPIQEKGNKYVVVNVAACILQAVDTDSILEMRVCCGSPTNKTPLLNAKMMYLELNPYWNVPKKIIRKELVPALSKDTAYFTHNRFKVYDKAGRQVNPHTIKWQIYGNDIPYIVKQDNKKGNSLGRIVFRFPNAYSVYLHDTSTKWAFMNAYRWVSHGCVRIEKVLSFADFLMKDKNRLVMDRIRVAMDLPALTAEGRKLTSGEDYTDMKHYSLKEYIPIFLDYYTVYLSKNKELKYCSDVYRFDAPLLNELNRLNISNGNYTHNLNRPN